jgi:tetratricopeptide (TPR) repeat protein
MGWLMVSLGDYASAERFLQQAIEKDASFSLSLLHLGQLYLQEQQLERAYPYIKRASILSGQDAIGQIAKRLLLRYYGEVN